MTMKVELTRLNISIVENGITANAIHTFLPHRTTSEHMVEAIM